MTTNNELLKKAYSVDELDKMSANVMKMISDQLRIDIDANPMNYIPPNDQLEYWREDFKGPQETELTNLLAKIRAKSLNFHSKRYIGHQVAVTLPITILTSAFISYLNNATTIYEVGMAGNAMEQVVINHLIEKFGYENGSMGVIVSGGSMGNLTALLRAKATSGIEEKDFHRLAVMVSEEAHYSVSRAASIMGILSDNIIKIPVNDNCTVRTDLLESIYNDSVSKSKIVFCIVGCACTTSVGAYDDLEAISAFANKHQIWFHIDGAHGGPAIFSEKYKHLLRGVEHSDSISIDFHKMMMTPPLSTALLYNKRNKKQNKFSLKADYLWQDEMVDEWHHSAKHTVECTKPVTIIHTYAILKIYGDEIYAQNVETLYDLGSVFADLVSERERFELALRPSSNIVCFRYKPVNGDVEEVNKEIAQKMLEDGTFYIVNTKVHDRFFLRVTIMNPLTDRNYLVELLDKIEQIGKEIDNPKK